MPAINRFYTLNELAETNRSCVFISHQKQDKNIAKAISAYFIATGIDVYFDEYDVSINRNDPYSVVASIRKGLNKSTHLLCILTNNAIQSRWVPWEIGYVYALNRVDIYTLTDKIWSEKTLPEYLQITNILRGRKTLNDLIMKLRGLNESQMRDEVRFFSSVTANHPLYGYLNLEK